MEVFTFQEGYSSDCEQRHRKTCVTRSALTWYNQPHKFSKLHNEDYLLYYVSCISMKRHTEKSGEERGRTIFPHGLEEMSV